MVTRLDRLGARSDDVLNTLAAITAKPQLQRQRGDDFTANAVITTV
jgi:hypothetical protein